MRTVLSRSGQGRVIPHNTAGYLLPGVNLIEIKGDCWTLVEVCVLLSAFLAVSPTIRGKADTVLAGPEPLTYSDPSFESDAAVCKPQDQVLY